MEGELVIMKDRHLLYIGGGKWDPDHKDVVRHGEGTEFDSTGRRMYSGKWNLGKRNGMGSE